MPLTIQNVRDASPRERLYALYDGHGLCLHVTRRGSKLWRYRYRFAGREKMISLGMFPKVTLPAARRQHADARGLLLRGIDPSDERRARRAAASRTFEAVARSWLKSLDLLVSKGSLALDTVNDARRILERFVFPTLGSRPIWAITPQELLIVLKQIELKGLRYTARRAKQRCSRVFRHAIGLGYASRDITEDLRGLLEPPVIRHRPAIIEPKRLGELLGAVEQYKRREVTRSALRLLPMLFVRPGELRTARWRQIDFENAQWRIPAAQMKSRVQHIVPLSRQAMCLLRRLRSVSGDSEYVFPSPTDDRRPLHARALSAALRSLGFSSTEVTPHGFRATACTLLNEMGWHSEAIERQMAHGTSNAVRRHYNYAQHLPVRRVMMQAWANYLDELRSHESERAQLAEAPPHTPNRLPCTEVEFRIASPPD